MRPFGVGAGWWQRISAARGLRAEPEHCVSTKANQINGWKNRQRKMKRRGFGPFGISIRLLEMGRVQASSQILHFGFLRSVFMEVPPQPLQVGSGWYSGAPGGTGLPRVPLLPCATWAASSTDCQPPGPGGDSEPRAPGVFLPPFVIAAQPSARRGGTRTQTRLVQPAHGHGRGHWGHKQRGAHPCAGSLPPTTSSSFSAEAQEAAGGHRWSTSCFLLASLCAIPVPRRAGQGQGSCWGQLGAIRVGLPTRRCPQLLLPVGLSPAR